MLFSADFSQARELNLVKNAPLYAWGGGDEIYTLQGIFKAN